MGGEGREGMRGKMCGKRREEGGKSGRWERREGEVGGEGREGMRGKDVWREEGGLVCMPVSIARLVYIPKAIHTPQGTQTDAYTHLLPGCPRIAGKTDSVKGQSEECVKDGRG